MKSNQEIFKTEHSKLYPQIYNFNIWEGKEEKSLAVQGLQHVSCTMIFSDVDGSISIPVLEHETLTFDFSKDSTYHWVTATVEKGVR